MYLMWSWKVVAFGLVTISATVCAFSTSQSSCNARDLSLYSLSSKTASFCSTRDIPFTTANSVDSPRGGSVTTRTLREHLGIAMTGDFDLYIVGAGYLGTLIGRKWRVEFPSATVYAETRSGAKHGELEEEGFTPTLRDSRSEGVRCPTVVFCAAPSGNDDYAAEVSTAAKEVWDGNGVFLFTSSGGIYAEKDGGKVDELSPLSDSPRAEKLKSAEAACLRAGGTVVRLAGLYSVERGPHNFWLGKDEVDSSPDGLINLLSYEDAADAAVAALVTSRAGQGQGQETLAGRILLAADDVPTSRRDICEHALRHPLYAGRKAPKFNDGAPGAGATKYFDMTVTRRDLGWSPRYRSFGEFMEMKATEARQEGA